MTLHEKVSNYQDENKDMDFNPKSDNPPWINDSEDGSDDDEWLFESMQRYKQLCTYSIVCEATSIDIHADSRQLVIAGKRSLIANKANNQAMYEVAIYRIPEKLVIVDNEEKEGLSNGRDLSLLAGIGLERNVIQVKFLSSDMLVTAQKNDISIWCIKPESDLLIKLKSASLEIPELPVNIMTTSENSILLGFFRLSKMEIHELSLKWDANKSQICELTTTQTQIIDVPKDLSFEKFESFTKELVTILSTNISKERHFLFFELHCNSENKISLEYLGGMEDVDTSRPNYKLLVSSWIYTKLDGVLGATIKTENFDEEAGHLSLHIYHSKTLDKKLVRSNMCSQKIQLHNNECLDCPGNINVLRNNVNVQLVPSSDSVMSTIYDTDERPSKLFAYTLVVKIEAKVNLYQMNFHVLSKAEDSKAWKVDCNLLFCHDAHKSLILHALQYSTRLPQLFISVDENKELHAWHWQNQDKSKKI